VKSLKKFALLGLCLLVTLAFSSMAFATPVVTFTVNATQPIMVCTVFTVDIFLEDGGDFLSASSFGAFFDYDDTQVELMSATASTAWADNTDFKLEPTADWYTAAGWAGLGYAADVPADFEEGPDILVMSLMSLAPVSGMKLPLGTLEFHCLGEGTMTLAALNRPDANWTTASNLITGGVVNDDAMDWAASKATIDQVVPIPGTFLLLFFGLMGLTGLKRKFQ
jgi:hypothetical protein